MTPGQKRALEEAWPTYGLETNNGLLDISVLFPSGPVVLEIGFGMGDSLFEMASNNPDNNYIGVEVHKPGVGHLLNRAENDELQNLKVFAEDSIDVLKLSIPETSLDVVHLFPGPVAQEKAPQTPLD